MKQGKAIIFSAPSGAGKTTIVRHLLKQPLNLEFSVSACSREPREHEVHGKDYYFLTLEEFKNRISEKAFAEWEQVYENMYYGTLNSELDRIWKMGKHVIFDVDVVGGINLKNNLGNRALSIFVQPPSIQALEDRLRKRGTESEASLSRRIAKAKSELEQARHFDVILINDDLAKTLKEAEQLVKNFLES